jgi:hypothetical protein
MRNASFFDRFFKNVQREEGLRKMSDECQNGASAVSMLAGLCNEAAAVHGADWEAIEKYVADRLQNMSEGDRSCLMRQVRAILAFRAPQRRPKLLH